MQKTNERGWSRHEGTRVNIPWKNIITILHNLHFEYLINQLWPMQVVQQPFLDSKTNFVVYAFEARLYEIVGHIKRLFCKSYVRALVYTYVCALQDAFSLYCTYIVAFACQYALFSINTYTRN